MGVPWTARRSNQSILKEISPKGNLFPIFIGRTDAEAEAPILSPDVKNQFTGKYLNSGKDSEQEKVTTQDKMVGCHH